MVNKDLEIILGLPHGLLWFRMQVKLIFLDVQPKGGNCRGSHKITPIVTSAVRVVSTATRVTSCDLTYLYKLHQLRYRENIARVFTDMA